MRREQIWWDVVDIIDDIEHGHVALCLPLELVDGIHGAFQRANGFVQRRVIIVSFIGVLQDIVQQEDNGGKALDNGKDEMKVRKFNKCILS